MPTLKDLEALDIEKELAAIEADAGHPIPGLRQSLEQLKAGEFAAVHTPEQIAGYKKLGRPPKANPKVLINIRVDPDILEALKASGPGWQTRANDLLRADIKAGRLAKLASA